MDITITIFPFNEEWAALLDLLEAAELRVQQPGGPEPEAPYLRLEPAGWQPASNGLRPMLGVEIVHAANATAFTVWHAAQTENIVYSLLWRSMLHVGTAPAAVEDKRLVSRSVWSFI